MFPVVSSSLWPKRCMICSKLTPASASNEVCVVLGASPIRPEQIDLRPRLAVWLGGGFLVYPSKQQNKIICRYRKE